MRKGPLSGRTVVLTRSEDRADDLRRALEAMGAEVLVIPTIRHAPACDDGAIARVVAERLTFSHLAFASQTAVSFFFDASRRHGVDAGAWRGVRIAAVGPRTAGAVEKEGLAPVLVSSGGGASLAHDMIAREGIERLKRVLLPQSSIARPELGAILESSGVAVAALTVYETLTGDPTRSEPLLERLRRNEPPDAVHFASPSAVGGFLSLCGAAGRSLLLSPGTRVLAIGATTAQALREAGFRVDGEAGAGAVDDSAERIKALLG